MKSNVILFLGLMISSQAIFGQQGSPTATKGALEESSNRYKLALSMGYSHIPAAFEAGNEEKAVFVPSIGLDFFYFLNEKWALGLVADQELANYVVKFDREDLDRERSLILAALVSYELLPRWGLLAGGGIELESHKNLGVVRVGTEYEFPLGKSWSIAPSLFFDFKEAYSTWTLGVGISKAF